MSYVTAESLRSRIRMEHVLEKVAFAASVVCSGLFGYAAVRCEWTASLCFLALYGFTMMDVVRHRRRRLTDEAWLPYLEKTGLAMPDPR